MQHPPRQHPHAPPPPGVDLQPAPRHPHPSHMPPSGRVRLDRPPPQLGRGGRGGARARHSALLAPPRRLPGRWGGADGSRGRCSRVPLRHGGQTRARGAGAGGGWGGGGVRGARARGRGGTVRAVSGAGASLALFEESSLFMILLTRHFLLLLVLSQPYPSWLTWYKRRWVQTLDPEAGTARGQVRNRAC